MTLKKIITTSVTIAIIAGLMIGCSQSNKVEATTENNMKTLKKLSSIDLGNAIAYEVQDTTTGKRFMITVVKGQGGVAIEELSI